MPWHNKDPTPIAMYYALVGDVCPPCLGFQVLVLEEVGSAWVAPQVATAVQDVSVSSRDHLLKDAWQGQFLRPLV